MDKALVFGTKDCRFESCQGQVLQACAPQPSELVNLDLLQHPVAMSMPSPPPFPPLLFKVLAAASLEGSQHLEQKGRERGRAAAHACMHRSLFFLWEWAKSKQMAIVSSCRARAPTAACKRGDRGSRVCQFNVT